MTNNISLKSPTGPWYTIEAENHDDAVGKLLALLGGAAPPSPVSLPTLIGLAQLWYTAELNIGLGGIAASPINVQAAAPLAPPPVSVVQPQPAAAPYSSTAGTDPWQAPEVPQYQPPAASAPTAPTTPPGASLPPGVVVWTAPNPEQGKEQYTELWFEYPYIRDANDRATLKAAFNAAGVKPWFYSPTKKWITKTGNEAAVRAVLTQNAALFA